jgi:hypothetical protein
MKRVSFQLAAEYTNRRRAPSPWRAMPIRDMLKADRQDFSRTRPIFGRRPPELALDCLRA